MIDNQKRVEREKMRERTRRRMQVNVDPENYEYYPEQFQADFFDNDIFQRVAIYVRVSTTDTRQTTSYELQKKYYEEFVIKHPNWELNKIYADEGISGTSLKHRDAFNQMIADAKAEKFNFIICKSVSRFSRNVADCIPTIRALATLKKPVGIYFESEGIFTLKEDKSMGLNMMAAMAEEESNIRSRSMEASLRMRLDHGLPLTPELLGYSKDAEGHLVINPEEAPTVKLAFYMYLYGYSTQQIADTFTALQKRSYLGNIDKWTSGAIVQILRNERHCGEVLTRKTFTVDMYEHKVRKNKGQRPRAHYKNHHEPIVSRDDYIAVQRLLDNAKFRCSPILPELRVIRSGILQGYVSVNPRWAGFGPDDYFKASLSAYSTDEESAPPCPSEAPVSREYQIEGKDGAFDLRGFEITRSEMFDFTAQPFVTFWANKLRLNAICVDRFGAEDFVELLVNPVEMKLAVRPTVRTNRNGIKISTLSEKHRRSKTVSAAAFCPTLYQLFNWNPAYNYRIVGSLVENEEGAVYIFHASDSIILLSHEAISNGSGMVSSVPIQSGNKIAAFPREWTGSFGQDFYLHEQSFSQLVKQKKEDWKLHMEGQLCNLGHKLNVTPFEDLKAFIQSEVGDILFLGGDGT